MSKLGLSSDEVGELRRSRDKAPTPRQERELARCSAVCQELKLKQSILEDTSALDPFAEDAINEANSEIKRRQRAILSAERKQPHEKISEILPDVKVFGVSIISLLTFTIL